MKRRIGWLLTAICLLASLAAGCAGQKEAELPAEPVRPVTRNEAGASLPMENSAYGLTAAVLYDGEGESVRWQDTMELLEQSVLLGLTAEAVDASADYDLSSYDLVIPDRELADSPHMERLGGALQEFTADGGYVLLDNAFSQVLPKEYLGISGTQKLETCPLDLTWPELGADLYAIQEVIADFAVLYPEYYEAEELLQRDYGYGFTADGAQPLAMQGDQAIYLYNTYGQGGVFLTNPLLPNSYSLGNYAMTHREDGETAFASTTASCNQLLYSRFAGFAAKQRYGYALNRVYGYHGSPSMAWELHYEEITAYANDAMAVFDTICREYQQIPSYTIIRSSYWWFLRAETVTYLCNQSTDGYEFAMDFEDSAYSSGAHMVSDGQWLSLGKIEDAGSYFRDYPEYDYRAYPVFTDVDGDGETELICGSYDGYLYRYDDLSYSDRLHVSAAEQVTDPDGNALRVSGYSAPQAADLDGDGVNDLLTGSNDGCIYWYHGAGNGTYVNQGVLLNTNIRGQALPSLSDVNGDGVPDLVVGSDQGILLCYYGSETETGLYFDWHKMESWTRECVNNGLGSFLAPTAVDWNSDGNADLAIGTFDGYIAKLLGDGKGSMTFAGYVDVEEMNYKGNHHIKFGNQCVPAFYDVNGDGAEDLVCGSLEYGLAYPIDSEYFPYREELQFQLNQAAGLYQYVGVHHYSNGFASAEREAYELRRHKEALASYGVSTEGTGANMHTWYTSVLGDTQTFDAEYAAGLLWNSGFSSPGDPGAAPQYAAENVIALPFFLQKEGEDTLLVQNNSVLPYADTAWSDISAKYRMPICVYYHCDFVYEEEAGARDYLQKVSDYQSRFAYNFVREDQMMEASAAARHLEVLVEQEADGSLYLRPYLKGESFFDETAQTAMGVEVEFAENVDAASYKTDAGVWRRNGNRLYLSLGDGVHLSRDVENTSPLRQVNLPADITCTEEGITIAFLGDGMMQAVAETGYTTDCTGWNVTERENGVVFTKYGSADTLQLRRSEE